MNEDTRPVYQAIAEAREKEIDELTGKIFTLEAELAALRSATGAAVYAKIAQVMAQLEQIPTDYDEGAGFAYLPDHDLVGALRPLMGAAGLVCEMIPVNLEARERPKAYGAEVDRLVAFTAECSIIDGETGARTTPITITVETYDQGDKTREILATRARKTYLSGLFLVGAEPTDEAKAKAAAAARERKGKRNENRGQGAAGRPARPAGDRLRALVSRGYDWKTLQSYAEGTLDYHGGRIVEASPETIGKVADHFERLEAEKARKREERAQ